MKKYIKRSLLALAAIITVTAVFIAIWIRPPAAAEELLFYGGPVITMADAGVVEAVLVRDGKIVAVGDEAEVRALASPSVTKINLDGKTLMPGLIEPHSHMIASALLGAAIDVSGFAHDSRAEVMATLRRELDDWQGGEWAIAFGWDPVMVDDLEPPTLAELDALSPERPLVILTQMMHDAYANSKALKAAGILEDSPNPPGGEYVRDADGKLTGTLREVGAIGVILGAPPAPPKGAADLLLNLQMGAYARAGYTTVAELGPVGRVHDPVALLKRRLEAESAPIRGLIYALPPQIAASQTPEDKDKTGAVVGVKFWMDGSPYAGGAAFEEPYEDSALVRNRLHLKAGHRGALNYSGDDFEAAFAAYHKRGYQIAVHVQGERAVARVLDAAEKAFEASPRADHRHRLEHNALITKAQLERAQALGFTTSFFIDHIYFYGHRLPELVGEARTQRYMPIRTALEAGHHVSFHGDHPATPIGPFRSFATAALRIPRRGDVALGAHERLSRLEALQAMTTGPAWQLGLEHERGSLEVGKSADLVMLSHNPLETDDADLRDIRAQKTWIEGREVDARVATRSNAGLLWDVIIGFF
ncbi:amidohydrolase [Kordiimonas sp.]|uniref:amidohydrolase n=1 Tax=Kordiimonas sp. TaxID=1970157 RepID=UPI003A91FC38